MNTLVVILSISAAVSADIGIGYQYRKPQTSYEVPSYVSSGSGFNSQYTGQGSVYKGQSLSSGSNLYQAPNVGLQSGFQNQALSSGAGYQSGSGYQSESGYQSGSGYQGSGSYQSGSGFQAAGHRQPSYQQPGVGYQSGTKYQTSGNYHSRDGNQYQSGSIGSFSSGSSSLTAGPAQSGYQSLNQYQTSSQSNAANYQQYYNQIQQQPPQIFKHFYVHAAPEEPELARPRQPLILPAPQKHYKIIFIKTPAPAASSAQIIPVQQQNEEKTIVYVLVKKPEEVQDLVVPKVDQKPPSKPEVYFIKYKGKEDSQAVIKNIVNEYNSGKENVNFGSAVYSTGTLDGIPDTKYVTQSGSSSLQSVDGGFQSAAQGSSGSFSSQSYEASGSSDGQASSLDGTHSGSVSGLQSQSFGSSDGSSGYQVSTAAPVQVGTISGGYDSFSSTVSSSSVIGDASQANVVSTNQGVPHQTYGPPKFKEY